MTGSRPALRTVDVLRDRRVLVVEDDPTVLEVLTRYLEEAGFMVSGLADGVSALRLVQVTPPDLVILDRMLPGIDGVEVVRRLHRMLAVPVIMLTALSSPEHRIEGLEAGVDDYVVKPFSAREIVLRVQSVLRRSLADFAPETPFELGPFRLDPNLRRIWLHGTELALSGRERDLLTFLLKHPEREQPVVYCYVVRAPLHSRDREHSLLGQHEGVRMVRSLS